MNSNPMNIITGLLLLFGISYSLISLYTVIYLRLASKKNIKKRRFWLSMAVVSLAWLIATVISVMFASSNGMIFFSAVSVVLIFAANYFLVERTMALSGKDKIFYCLILSVIINPTWYFILG